MAFIIVVLAVLAFAGALIRFGLASHVRTALEKASAGVGAMFDPRLDEMEKERAVQSAGLSLLGSSGRIAWRFAACLIAAALPIGFAYHMHLTSLDDVFGLMARWEFLVGSTLVLGTGAYVWNLSRGRNVGASDYGAADRLTHTLAFSGPGLQLAAADLEERLFAQRIAFVKDRPPVFIAALPRAGTTVLLNALCQLPTVATHTYRDMPFVMAPLLWAEFTRRFGRDGAMRERAHGDGLQIGYDSPEAFEEVIWQAFWPHKYHTDHIELWDLGDIDAEATAFFSTHFRKIVMLRTGDRGRYVSKNNANIARLDLLPAMFPGTSIVVPMRSPAEHAASLLRQHRNFLGQHHEYPFVARYMRDIGHLEFGALHTPIGFAGFAPGELTPDAPDYWLRYWLAAYKYVLRYADRLILLAQETVCAAPDRTLAALCAETGIKPEGHDFASFFRTPAPRADTGAYSAELLDEAETLYRELLTFDIGRRA